MDLELSDEQGWLSDAIATLLGREWCTGADTAADRRALWRSLAGFGALTVGGEEGLGAVEMCLIARALGEHLAPVPYLASAAVRFAILPLGASAPHAFARLAEGEDAVALAMLEPGSRWGPADLRTTIEPAATGAVLNGRKAAVEHAQAADLLAVVAATPDGPALALVSTAPPPRTAPRSPPSRPPRRASPPPSSRRSTRPRPCTPSASATCGWERARSRTATTAAKRYCRGARSAACSPPPRASAPPAACSRTHAATPASAASS